MRQSALRLVESGEQSPSGDSAPERGPVERVFAHWVFMLGKNPRRCALGPTRRKAIAKALALYDEDTLCLAIDGCASSPWHRGENDREREFSDIELILRDEAHVERFAADGERLRARLEARLKREAMQAAESAPEVVEMDAEAAAMQRQRLRQLADQLAGRTGGAA